MTLPLQPPVEPMLARLSRSMPDRDDPLLYEPKWDGFRCLVFRDGTDLQLQSRNGRDLTRYFPELPGPLRDMLPDAVVLDGELVVPRGGRLDFDALGNRIHPAESRIEHLAERTPGRFVAFDVLARDGDDLTGTPLEHRRGLLTALLDGVEPPLHLTPATTDPAVAADWFDRFEGAGLDGLIAKDLDGTYRPGRRAWRKIKHRRTADCVVGGYRVHKDGQGVGSLLLGLYDTAGRLRHIGVAASFRAARRAELLEELRPWRRDVGDHPWLDTGAGADATPRGENRWSGDRDTSWEPLRIELVAEVAYDQLEGDRLRHPAKLQRWRPDRDPASCTYDQLDVPPPAELAELFGGPGPEPTDEPG